jgi:hypothetical protein
VFERSPTRSVAREDAGSMEGGWELTGRASFVSRAGCPRGFFEVGAGRVRPSRVENRVEVYDRTDSNRSLAQAFAVVTLSASMTAGSTSSSTV